MVDALSKICVMAATVKASEDLAANRFVAHDGGYPDADGDSALGVTASAAKSGENVALDVLGISVVDTTAAAIGVGDALQADDDGRVRTLTSNQVMVGRALTAVPAGGGQVRVLLIPN